MTPNSETRLATIAQLALHARDEPFGLINHSINRCSGRFKPPAGIEIRELPGNGIAAA
jgi:hypothetical protein